jgi:hypothetical protein
MRARRKPSESRLNIGLSSSTPSTTAHDLEHGLSLIRRLVTLSDVGIANPSVATLKILTGGRSAAQVFELTPLFGAARSTPASQSKARRSS